MPRARSVQGADGATTEWKSQALRAYQRRTKAADALIAGAYLPGINTRRVRRALAALFGGAVGKDTVSRTWRKVKGDWDAWNARSLADEPIVRLILDGTVVRVRLDRKATAISLLVVIGVRDRRAEGAARGQEHGRREHRGLAHGARRSHRARPAASRVPHCRRRRRPRKALAAVWNDVPVQRCTVHKHRNLFAYAPERLHDEITADYTDMIYAATPQDIADRRKAFIRKWRLRHKAVADSLEEAGDALFAFAALPPSQWKSARTTDEMDKRFLGTSQIRGDLLQVCSLVRPRRRRFSVPTAALAAAARRGGQGWPRLARPPQGLVLIGPSTAACLIGSGLQRPDGWPRLALSGSTGTDRRRGLLLSRAGDLVAKSGASAASVAGQPHLCPADLRRPRAGSFGRRGFHCATKRS